MVRYALVVVAVAALAAIAMMAMPRGAAPPAAEQAETSVEHLEAVAAFERAQEEVAALHAELAALRMEKQQLEAEVGELQATIAQSTPMDIELAEEWLMAFDLDEDATVAQAALAAPDNNEGDPRQGGRAEWRERREEAAQRMQEQSVEFLARQYDRAPDLATQQRMSDLGANLNEIFELRRLMREAETDEERAELGEQLRTTWASSRELVSAQQQATMASAAEQLGLVTPEEQRAFAATVRQVMQDPFMRGGALFGGGGFGGQGGRSPRRGGQ